MNKEEILAKSRRENQKQDERDRVLTTQATSYGAIGMSVVFVILFILKMSRNQCYYDLFSLFFSFLASSNIFKYRLLKGRGNLFTAVCWTLSAAIFLALYIWRG